MSALQRVLRGKKPGESVELEAWRYGTRKTFTVRLTSAPKDNGVVADAGDEESAEPSPTHSRLGISMEPVPAELVRAARIPDEYRGVRVAEVEPGSPSDSRLFVGDVQNLRPFVLVLCLLGLSGCAARPIQVTCVIPAPPAPLMEAPPPPQSFTDRLNSILAPYLTSPETPTN